MEKDASAHSMAMNVQTVLHLSVLTICHLRGLKVYLESVRTASIETHINLNYPDISNIISHTQVKRVLINIACMQLIIFILRSDLYQVNQRSCLD